MILAYAKTTAIIAGETLSLHIALTQSEAPRTASLHVVCENIGADRPVHHLQTLIEPSAIDRDESWLGFDWPVSYTLRTSAKWQSGLYSLRDENGSPLLMFTVRPPKPRARLMVVVSFMTPNAYCNSGGKSLYDYNSVNGAAHEVGFQRPGLFAWYEMKLAEWLLKNAIDADWCSSLDVHRVPDLLQHYDVVLIGGHDEYWTATMRNRFEEFVAGGGRLIVLSGNTGHRQVRLSDDCTRMMYYSRADLDPESQRDKLAIDVADTPLDKTINRFLGAGWEYGAYGSDEKPAPYLAHFPSHWVFEGVSYNDQLHTQCSSAFMHYETDAAHWQYHASGHPSVTGIDGTSRNTVVLASADLSHWQGKPGNATVTLSCFGEGWIFHGGTTEWIEALNANDPRIERITHNVLNTFLRRDALRWNAIDHFFADATPKKICAHDGHLFWIDPQHRLWQRDAIATSVDAQCDDSLRRAGIGHVRSIAGNANRLWLLGEDSVLWSRHLHSRWQRLSTSDDEMAHTHIVDIATCGGNLYAIDARGYVLRYLPASSQRQASWSSLPLQPLNGNVRALASRNLHLLAIVATKQGCQLWRSNGRFVENSDSWICIGELPADAKTITLANDLLFLVTADSSLRIMPSAVMTGRVGKKLNAQCMIKAHSNEQHTSAHN